MTLALIAGSGGLPPLLFETLKTQGRAVIVCEARGTQSEILGEADRLEFRLETLGTFLGTLQDRGVTEVCMAGTIHRPQVDPSAIDAATAPLVPRLLEAISKGDDGTLRAFIALFEDRDMRVIGAHEVMPELLPAQGVPTKSAPPDLSAELAIAASTLADMARADLGQAMILRGGDVVAREDTDGTDALLARAAGARGGVLFKAPKPGQVMRADMPTIGIGTAKGAADAGLAGIVIEAGGVMVLDYAEVIAQLDAHGMFLWVRPKDQA